MTDELTNILTNSSGIRKSFITITLEKFITLIQNKDVIIADWNRDEVIKRPGDSHKLLASIAYGWNIGTLLGYWDGVLPASKTPTFTAEKPLQITEGGHRYRWIREIADNVATIQGNTLARIQTVNPELYQRIMEYKIRVDLTTHISGVVPLTYVKGEYQAINTLGNTLTVGEKLRAATDQNFNDLKDALYEAFSNRHTKMNKMTRDKPTEVLAGLIQIIRTNLSNDGGQMKPKEVLNEPDPSDEIMDNALDIINEIINLEEWLKQTYGKAKGLKAYVEETPKLDLFGPLVFGISKSTDTKTAVENIKQFYTLSLVDKPTWISNSNKVKGGRERSKGAYFDRKRYEVSWNQLLSIITPSSTIRAGDGITLEE